MSSTSNKLSQRGKILANKPMNEVNAQEEIFKINGNTTFVKNYARWLEEHNMLISEIQSGLNDHNNLIGDDKLLLLKNRIMKHYFELFEMKTSAANVDALKDGDLWRIGGGFRPSELLQVILPPLQHSCTQQQLSDISNLGISCHQAEEALALGLAKLHKTLDKATAAGDKGFQVTCVSQQMIFLKQANLLRREFLHQFSHLLTISQQAEFLLALGEHLHKHNPPCQSSL